MKNAVFFILIMICSAAQAQQEPEKVRDIDAVTINVGRTKFKNRKENPAYAVMKEVWARKRSNGLEKFDTYKIREYEKVEIDLANLDSTFADRKILKKIDFIFDYAEPGQEGRFDLPVFLTESLYQIYGENKPQKRRKQELTARKTSGFQNNEVISGTAQNLFRDIDIYDSTINFLDIGFTSPAAPAGFGVYDYTLMEDSSLRGTPVYRIHYQPRQADVLAFEGYLYIAKENFAVVQASLRSTRKLNVNFVNGIASELVYDNPDAETYLPKSVKTELQISPFSKSKDAKSLIAKRTQEFSNYEFNPTVTAKDFETKPEELSQEALAKDDEFWEQHRADSLSASEKGVYQMLERLDKTPHFRNIIKTYEMFASGYVNVGHAIDIGNIYSVYGKNQVEGDRIRIGARTYFSRNDDWRVQGYLAYGFRDEKFKYGIEGKYMFDKVSRLIVGAGTRRDIMQLGVHLTGDDGIMSRTFASSSVFGRGENISLSSVNQANVFSSVEPWKNFQIRLDGTVQSIKSANPEHFSLLYHYGDEVRQTLNDSHLSLSLIARPGAKYSQTGVDRYEQNSLAPTIVLKYTRGIRGLFNADFTYNKLQFLFFKPYLFGSWGKTYVNVEAGKNFDTVPLAIQNVIPGNQSYSIASNTFSQLNYYEFVADSYATLHLEHHFNGRFLAYLPLIKKLKLRELAFFRSAYGTLSQASRDINLDGRRYSAPDSGPYFEYGFGIENIGIGNLRPLRVDFTWRGNYLDRPGISRFGIKTGFNFNF